MMTQCSFCGIHKPLVLIREHMEDVHGWNEDIETWPDGKPVIIDLTLEPKDFE